MSEKLLQLNFKFNVSAADYEGAVTPLAKDFAAVPGLRWKIWLMNEDQREAGGLYMFEDAQALGAFLEGPLAKGVMSHPALSEFSAKTFDIMDTLTAVTRGPVKAAATA